jgi:peptidyl-prolyl cis-trans isomerase C
MKRLFLLCVTWLVLASCQDNVQQTLTSQTVSPVVAEVGDKKIYEVDIDFEIMSMPESMRYIMQDDEARAQVLAVMIKREVVAQKAKEMGLNLDPLLAYRAQKAEDEVLIQGVRDWQRSEFKHITDAEIKAYYEKHKAAFIVPHQIHARHILVTDKQTALEIIKQLKANPDSFPTLAAQYSIDDSTKSRGGDLNWFSRGDMVKPFEKVAFALTKKKSISKPIKTKFGWHIIQWLGERDEQIPSFEDVSIEIKSILEKEKLDAWFASLMNDADIEVLNPKYSIK